MDAVLDFVSGLPLWVVITAGAAFFVIVLVAVFLIRFFVVRKRLFDALSAAVEIGEPMKPSFSDRFLLRWSRRIEKFARKTDPAVIRVCGLDDLWIERLKERKQERDLKRVLEFAADKGLFTGLLLAIENPAYRLLLTSRLGDEPGSLRRIAFQGTGEPFSGRDAAELLADRMDEIREMAGDPEWPVRYFAVKVMLYDRDPRSLRATREAFYDSHPLIRRTVIEEFNLQGPDAAAVDPEPSQEQPKSPETVANDSEEGASSSESGTSTGDSGSNDAGDSYGAEDPSASSTGSIGSIENLDDTLKEFYTILRDLVLHDAAFEVRKAAWDRIAGEFRSVHRVDIQELKDDEAVHLLDFLQPDSDHDINRAMEFLASDNLELRLPAAIFLQQYGFLTKLLSEVTFQDEEALERNRELLYKAAEVKISRFLGTEVSSPASIYIALRILKETGNRGLIAGYVEQAFGLDPVERRETWEAAIECVRERGTESSVRLVIQELNRRKYELDFAPFILRNLPDGIEYLTVPDLLDCLKDPEFTANTELRNALRGAFTAHPIQLALSDLLQIVKADRSEYAHSVRITALQVLGAYKIPYCLQPVLEQLPILPVQEAREFAELIADYGGKEFDRRTGQLLEQADGRARAAVIASLPKEKVKQFQREIREALQDADPDVRIASVWALADVGDRTTLNKSFDMLRDPVERVRIAAAKALGQFGTQKNLETFGEVLRDENEVLSVKQAVVYGLGTSELKPAVDILVQVLDESDDERLNDAIIDELAGKTEKRVLAQVIEYLKDAEPALRDKITEVFKRMGEAGEPAIRELMSEDISSLKPYLTDILENTGYVEFVIRKLSHRDPKVRRDSASFLSAVGTKAAFRGIVLAARDPDQEVRVQVTKALEQLNSDSGNEILGALKEDPDRKIRKYTFWALERVKSKRLED
jgi:HEAT repeat protein